MVMKPKANSLILKFCYLKTRSPIITMLALLHRRKTYESDLVRARV